MLNDNKQHFHLQQGDNCTKISPCKNGARCEDVCNEIGYKCTCQPFYYGTHCDKVIKGNSF